MNWSLVTICYVWSYVLLKIIYVKVNDDNKPPTLMTSIPQMRYVFSVCSAVHVTNKLFITLHVNHMISFYISPYPTYLFLLLHFYLYLNNIIPNRFRSQNSFYSHCFRCWFNFMSNIRSKHNVEKITFIQQFYSVFLS